MRQMQKLIRQLAALRAEKLPASEAAAERLSRFPRLASTLMRAARVEPIGQTVRALHRQPSVQGLSKPIDVISKEGSSK